MAAIIKELTIQATPQHVWAALTKQYEIARWWTDDLSVRPEVGTLAEFRFSQGTFVVQFEVVELEEESKVYWIARQGPPHWAGTSVTWQLEPVHNGTRLVFNHDKFAQADRRYEITRAWWGHFLGSLQTYLETGKGAPGAVDFRFEREGITTSAIIEGRLIAATPERVWAALTNPDEIGHWWTNDLNAKSEVGSLAEFRFGEWGDFVLRFEIAELEQDKKVQWITRQGPPHWAGTSVTWYLEPLQSGTKVVFTHEGFAKIDEAYEQTRWNWRYFLDSLKSYLETGKGTPGTPPSIQVPQAARQEGWRKTTSTL
jgi:uncharacterized protein YndB with AHSA1/START domain